MLKDHYSFPAILTYEESGISIEFPDLPGCCPCADRNDTEMALRNAKEALGLHIYGMEKDGEEIPEPTEICNLKTQEAQIPVLVEVFMPPVRERISNRFVRKTVSLPSWLAALADESEVNYSLEFQNFLIEYLGVEPPAGASRSRRRRR